MDLKTKGAIQTIASEKTRNGWKQTQIVTHLKNRFPNVAPTVIISICREAKALIETAHSLEKDFVIGQHLERYNQKIQDALLGLEQLVDEEGEDTHKFFVITFENCLKTLYQKERLIGFHSKRFKIIINTIYKKIEVLKKNDMNFAIEKLSFEEQIELSLLLEKAKTK